MGLEKGGGEMTGEQLTWIESEGGEITIGTSQGGLTEDLAGTEEADSSDDDPTTEAYWLARGLSPESAKASAAKERDKRDEEFTGGYDPTNGNYYGPRGGQR